MEQFDPNPLQIHVSNCSDSISPLSDLVSIRLLIPPGWELRETADRKAWPPWNTPLLQAPPVVPPTLTIAQVRYVLPFTGVTAPVIGVVLEPPAG